MRATRALLWVGVLCIAVGSAVTLSTEIAEAQVIQYICAGGQGLFVNYYNNGNAALVVYQDVRYGLHLQPQVPGARYSNGSTYWWWQGYFGTLGYEAGPNIASNCRQTSGNVQPQPLPQPLPQPPVSGGTVAIGQRWNGGQVRLNVGDNLKVRLAGQGWTATQVDYYLMHYLGTGGFVLGQELNFRAVNPGQFVLILQQQGSGTRFTVGVTIGYGVVPFGVPRDPR